MDLGLGGDNPTAEPPLPANRPIDRTKLTGKQLSTSTANLLKAQQPPEDDFIAGLKADQITGKYNPIPQQTLRQLPMEQRTYAQLQELMGQLTPAQNFMYNTLPQTVANPQEQPRGFTTSVQNSNEVSPQTKVGVTSAYTPKANQVLINSSTKLVGGGLMKATNQVLTNLAQKGVPVTDQGVSDAIAVAKALDAKGKFDQASTIYDSLSGKLTEAGRSVQAASLLSSRTPQGLHFSAIAALKKAGVEATPAIQSTIKGFVNDIKQTAGGSDARTMATQKLINFVNNNLPRSKTDAALGIWRTGLLTGPETVAKVLVSHGITTPFEMAAQIPSALADRVMSLVTGKRGMTATFKGAGSGAVTGIKAMGTKMKSGVDVPNTGGFESDFGSATHQTAYEKFIGNLHGSLAKPAYGMRYKVSLNDQALTEAGNQGLSGAAKDKFVRDFVSNPPDKAINTANNDAQIATNQQRTSAGQAASAISNMKMGPVPVGKILAPFTRIPAAIGVNGLWNYTPFGIGKEVISAVTSGKFDQRVMAQAFGRSATGTTVAALGALLGAHGLMTLKAPSDPKERALWEAQGKQANSIKMGDKWISLNAMGPVGLVLGMGGAFGQAAQKNGGDIPASLASALASGGRLLLDQPYLKGIAGVGQALNDPTRYGQTLFDNTVGSVVPAVSSQVARGSDTVQRMYPKGLADQFKGEIPGLRSQLPVQRDLYGNPVAGANPGGTVAGGAVGTVNPFYPSQAKSDPVTSELQRLYDSIGSTGSPNVAQIPANQTVYGQKVKLNNQQISDFTAQVGPQVKQELSTIMSNPAYSQLTDTQKATIIGNVIAGVRGSDYQLNQLLNSQSGGQNPQTQTQTSNTLNNPTNPPGASSLVSAQTRLSGQNSAPLMTPPPGGGTTSSTALSSLLNTSPSGNGTPKPDKYAIQAAKDQLTNDPTKPYIQVGSTVLYNDPTTGTVKSIDTSYTPKAPTLTGNASLDKKLTTQYNSELTTAGSNVVKLYKMGLMNATQAGIALDGLTTQKTASTAKLGTAKVKGAKKITISTKAAPLPNLNLNGF